MNAAENIGQPVLPRSLLQRFAKQIAFGVVCTIISTLIVQFAHIKQAVLIMCGTVSYVGGNPVTGEGGVVKKVEDKIDKIEAAIAKKVHSTGHIPVPAKIPTLHKTPEQLETEARLKEEREQREYDSKRKVVMARLESLEVPFDGEDTLEKLIVELKDAEDMQRKRPLLEHADKIGLHVDPKEPYDILQKRIKEAEADAEYQEQVRLYERRLEAREELIRSGPNASCPDHRCNYQFRTKRKMGDYRCPRCSGIYTIGRARASWRPPPMPQPPKRKQSMTDRVKGLFGR